MPDFYLQHLPEAGARIQGQGYSISGYGPQNRDLQTLSSGIWRNPGPDDRGEYLCYRSGVCCQETQLAVDSAEMMVYSKLWLWAVLSLKLFA